MLARIFTFVPPLNFAANTFHIKCNDMKKTNNKNKKNTVSEHNVTCPMWFVTFGIVIK